MNAQKFFAELRRRKVYRVAVAYAIVGWLLIQIATQVFPFFEVPMWAVRLVVILLVLGFPVALLAWAFDLTPSGIIRTDELDESPDDRATGSRKSIRPVQPAPPPEKSIAVLPFENFSDDVKNAHFADGIQDDILSSLAKVADLKVTSRTSVRQFRTGTRNLREIGEALGVAYILEGSVRRESNRVRINAQLIDARTDLHVWNLTDLRHTDAGGEVIFAPIDQRRHLRFAGFDHVGTPRMKGTADRRLHWRRRIARQNDSFPQTLAFRIGNRHGADQRFRVGMKWPRQHLIGRAQLHDFSEIHHGDPI